MASELKHSDGVKSSNISLGQTEAFQKAFQTILANLGLQLRLQLSSRPLDRWFRGRGFKSHGMPIFKKVPHGGGTGVIILVTSCYLTV